MTILATEEEHETEAREIPELMSGSGSNEGEPYESEVDEKGNEDEQVLKKQVQKLKMNFETTTTANKP